MAATENRMTAISELRIFVAAAVRRQKIRRLTSTATGILVWGGLKKRKSLWKAILRWPRPTAIGTSVYSF